MAEYKINVQARTAQGKNQVDKLRNKGLVPGIIYHKDSESENVQVDALELRKVYLNAGSSALVELNLDGEDRIVLIKDVQYHPVKDQILHVDFQEVRANEKIKVTIPIVLNGRDDIHVQPSVLFQLLEEIDVECFPRDIPQTAEVDVSEMDIGDVKTVSDLDIYSNEALDILLPGEEPVAALNEPSHEEEELEEEEEEEELSAADVPEIGEEEEEGAEEAEEEEEEEK